MITNLLTSINKQLEELNYQLKDNDYLNDLENKINVINESINKTNQENRRLHSIIKEVREYISNTKMFTYGEEKEFFLKDYWYGKELLEILDKGE